MVKEPQSGKAAVRAQCLARRQALPAGDVAERSARILARLEGLEAFQQAPAVLCYVASKDNEVDTRPLLARLLAAGRAVYVPVAEPGGALAWHRLGSLDELAPGRFGILEPPPGVRRIETPPPEAFVVVPGIAFSPEGDRIGYGGGYYDRFLAQHAGPRAGLAFNVQIVQELAPDRHDVRLPWVITEDTIYPDPSA